MAMGNIEIFHWEEMTVSFVTEGGQISLCWDGVILVLDLRLESCWFLLLPPGIISKNIAKNQLVFHLGEVFSESASSTIFFCR